MKKARGCVSERKTARHLPQGGFARPLALAAILALGAGAAALALNAAPAKVQSAAQASKPAADAAGSAENGKRLFKKDGCYECHGLQAQGSSTTGPRLGPDPVPLQVLIEYVRKPTGEMPPYTAKVISDKELGDIYA
ncbi:MAG: c-type cytochrome, partial [Terriglobia bacterium]